MGSWLTGDSPQDIMRDSVNPQIDRARQEHGDYQNQIRDLMGASGYDFMAPQTTTTRGGGTRNYNRLSTPEIMEQYKGLEGMMRGLMEQRMGLGGSLPPGYEQRAISAINQASAGAERAAMNKAAAAGFGGAQTYAAQAPIQAARAAQIADLRAQTPLLERQLTNEDLGLSSMLTEKFGRGQRDVGSERTSQWGETTSPAQIQDYLQYLAMAYGPYDAPIVVPQGRQGALGSLLGAGGQAAGAYLGRG